MDNRPVTSASTAADLEGRIVTRVTPLIVLSSLAIVAGCSDQATSPTVPTRPTAIITTYPTPEPYSVSVDPVVILDGFPGSNFNFAVGVNSLGDATGVSFLDGNQHVTRWPAGSTAPIDVAVGTAGDINTAGQFVGELQGQAALWTPDGFGGYTVTRIDKQLPSAIFSTASAINATGQVVGNYRVVVSEGVWVDKCLSVAVAVRNAPTGTVTTLPGLGGNFCSAGDVNSSGFVVGNATTVNGDQHGFVWSPGSFGRLGKIQDLTPRDIGSSALSINDARQIVGQHVTDTDVSAALWKPTGTGSWAVVDLGTFTGNAAWASDINEAGFVIGWARHENGDDDAFIWQNGEFTLLPGLPAVTITNASAMTPLNGNTLQVVGASVDNASGVRNALRWNVTFRPKK